MRYGSQNTRYTLEDTDAGLATGVTPPLWRRASLAITVVQLGKLSTVFIKILTEKTVALDGACGLLFSVISDRFSAASLLTELVAVSGPAQMRYNSARLYSARYGRLQTKLRSRAFTRQRHGTALRKEGWACIIFKLPKIFTTLHEIIPRPAFHSNKSFVKYLLPFIFAVYFIFWQGRKFPWRSFKTLFLPQLVRFERRR